MTYAEGHDNKSDPPLEAFEAEIARYCAIQVEVSHAASASDDIQCFGSPDRKVRLDSMPAGMRDEIFCG